MHWVDADSSEKPSGWGAGREYKCLGRSQHPHGAVLGNGYDSCTSAARGNAVTQHARASGRHLRVVMRVSASGIN